MTGVPQLPTSIFRTLVHFAPDAFLVADHAGTIVFANGEAERLFGYEREQLIGTAVEVLIPERLREEHIGHRSDYWLAPRSRPMGIGLTLHARRRDGSVLPVEISLSPVYSDEQMYVVATVRDVTDRRRMERALRTSEERYRVLAENAEDVVYRIGLDTWSPRFEYVSPSVEALTGVSPARFYDDPGLLFEITHVDDRALLERWLRDPEGIEQPLSLRAVRPDGSVVWHEQRFHTVRGERGTLEYIEGIARDVTEQRRLEEERRLLQAEAEIERERERISADLHDGVMQTMYSVGLQLSSFLRRVENIPDDSRASLEEAIESLDGAIRDIRRYVMDLRPVDFTGNLDDSLESLLRLFETTSGVTASFEVNRPLPAIDEQTAVELFLLAREALSNVRRHAEASHVQVTLRPHEGRLELALVDDGVGFDQAAKRQDEQFGLRNMETRVRVLGGDLVIDSAPGRGTTVIVSLPLERIVAGVEYPRGGVPDA